MISVSDSTVVSFPLERPMLRARARGQSVNTSLPYFISGEENRLANFVCSSMSGVFELGNPLLLVGPVGSGKTALALHLAARQALSMNMAHEIGNVVYLPAVDFARDYAEAAGAEDMPPFRSNIDEAPILVIDDLHLIAEKSSAQDELANRIDARTAALKPTLITCRRLPSEIRALRPRLVSRVLHGLTVPLRAPTGDARRLILRELGLTHGIDLDADLLETLDSSLGDDLPVRSLDAAIKQIDLWCRMKDSPVGAEAIQSAVDTIGRSVEIELSKITQTVARHLGLKTADLRSSSRKQTVVRGRSLAMLIARRMTSKSLDQIGKYFGGRDHSTVLHAIRKTESMLTDDPDLQLILNDVSEKISA